MFNWIWEHNFKWDSLFELLWSKFRNLELLLKRLWFQLTPFWAYTSSQFYQCKLLFLPQFDKVLISGDTKSSAKEPRRSRVRYCSHWLRQMQTRASKCPLGLSFPAPRRVVPVLHRWASGGRRGKTGTSLFFLTFDGGGAYFTLDWLGDIGRWWVPRKNVSRDSSPENSLGYVTWGSEMIDFIPALE